MSNYKINNSIKTHLTIIEPNYEVKKNDRNKINPKNIKKNLFDEEKIVSEIFIAIHENNYIKLRDILSRFPNFEEITELYFSIVEELKKHNYKISQLMAISTLLYRLSNIQFASVILPKPFPPHSLPSIANIIRNKELKNAKKIDSKIQEIVKNMITHYNIEIINNKNYNSSNAGQLALKLKNILLSFIIDYTKPESSKPLKIIINNEKIFHK